MSGFNNKEFIQIVKERHPNWEIIGDIPLKSHESTKIICHKCNQIYLRTRRQLLEKYDCPYCKGLLVIPGVNDVLTLHPWIKKYVDEKELVGIASNNKKYVLATCPDCNFTRQTTVKNLVSSIHKCPNCSDGVSYPNKYGRSFLKQLPIQNLITEYCPQWTDLCKYDNYFEFNNKKYLLEMDGGFHYIEIDLGNTTLEERQYKDYLKDLEATKHNIQVIRIDASQSDSNFLKKQFLNSEFKNIFDLSIINWDKCDKEASKNLLIEVCNYFNEGEYNTLQDIANKFNISLPCVNRYLTRGRRMGICGYFTNTYQKRKDSTVDPSAVYLPKQKPSSKRKSKKIKIQAFDENKLFIGEYDSIQECADELNKKFPFKKFAANKISEVSKGDKQMKNRHKGFYFKRLDPDCQAESRLA